MLLSDLLYNVSIKAVSGKTNIDIVKIEFDSRLVGPNMLFVAIPGTVADGHKYIDKAISAGASAILCEVLPENITPGITYIQVDNSPRAMGIAAGNFFDNPSEKIILVGVTGTNGKTSIATLLFDLFRRLGYKCGLLSTVHNKIEDEIYSTERTTPDSIKINELLATMSSKGCTHVFMEVSSHAVVQERIAGLKFSGGIFTNITQDHLDFHQTFDAYIKAKKGFFDSLPKTAFSLTNIDDRNGNVMLQNTKSTKHSYSLRSMSDFKGKLLDIGFFGIQMDVNGQEVWFKLIGKFNAYNLLAVYGAAVLLGEDSANVLTELSQLTPPPGRFEQVISKDGIVGIVDYAHTPDALKNVLETINELRQGNEKVYTVVGCGGNRDKGKRPQMAAIAADLSDLAILTSDNPRDEEPESILDDMMAGITITRKKKAERIVDRREAIRYAVSISRPGDIILIAGKGHETYQEIHGLKSHFDDREELRIAYTL